jgi:hypothetical protein
VAVEGTKYFLALDFDSIKFDATVEIHCEAAMSGIQSRFSTTSGNTQDAVEFTQFAIVPEKELKMLRFLYNVIATIWKVLVLAAAWRVW